ncbi:flavin reductase [Actinopolyspora erythraea]|uniref:Flavin reductase n=1 Tax=Actinopolyspora erythraea TaxID=414996 RepID=A0A223RWL4_9ACTN|nr:flavin reductase family protein [Actinopolyspora erythraea]ASU80272.1 flavin reductase [Actinopolyspora erythraea]
MLEAASDTNHTTIADTEIPPHRFRTVLSRFATGVVAIAALDTDDRPIGFTINSFTSVSLEPPLVAYCVTHTSRSWPSIRAARRHCLTILADTQRSVCTRLAGKELNKFEGLRWSSSPTGLPILANSLAWLECSVAAEYPAGDHVIVVARVHHAESGDAEEPLVFFESGYGTFDAS